MTPFEKHRIEHLSASALNLWLNAPSLWVMERLLHIKGGGVGCAAHRGTASEAGIVQGLFDTAATDEACVATALGRYDRLTALSGDPKREDERKNVEGMVPEGLRALRPYGVPTKPEGDHQHKITVQIADDLPPLVGYLDLLYERHGLVVDVKTTTKIPSDITDAHKRQAAIYQKAMGNHATRFCYISTKKHATYELSRDDYETAIRTVEIAARRLGKFLSISDDAQELAALISHDSSSFYWNDPVTKANGVQVYGY